MLQILHLDAKMALVKAQYKELAAEALKNTKNKTLADVTNAARKGSVHKPATIGIASSFTPARICNSYTPGSLAGSSAARSARSMTHTPQFVPVQPVQPVQPVELALPLAEQVSPLPRQSLSILFLKSLQMRSGAYYGTLHQCIGKGGRCA